MKTKKDEHFLQKESTFFLKFYRVFKISVYKYLLEISSFYAGLKLFVYE